MTGFPYITSREDLEAWRHHVAEEKAEERVRIITALMRGSLANGWPLEDLDPDVYNALAKRIQEAAFSDLEG